MKLSQFVIGIDGGGTKTAAIIADLNGNILAQHMAGPSNFQIHGSREISKGDLFIDPRLLPFGGLLSEKYSWDNNRVGWCWKACRSKKSCSRASQTHLVEESSNEKNSD